MELIFLKLTKSKRSWVIASSFCTLFILLFAGCFANYGRLQRDYDVFQAFNTDQVPMDYRYYYYHSGSEPIAVVGVEKKYDAGSKMWREIDPDTQKFRDMIYWIWEDFGYTRFGAKILDPSGMQVGIIYTAVREVAFKFTDDNRIIVMPNTPFLWGEVGEDDEETLTAESDTLPPSRQKASMH